MTVIMELVHNVPPLNKGQKITQLSLLESIVKTCNGNVVLTFKSVDEILWCDHLNETFLAVVFHGTICFSIFYKIKFGIFLEF